MFTPISVDVVCYEPEVVGSTYYFQKSLVLVWLITVSAPLVY